MRASSLCFLAAVLLAIIGMGWGMHMAMTDDHTAMPAHAHLNLLGWVSLFLFGIFYHLHPQTDRSRVALAQAGVWIVATVVQAAGVALVLQGNPVGEPMAAVSSLVALADMLLFGWLVVRRERVERFA